MRNKILMIVSFLTVVFVLNSCLKDNVGMDWTSSLKGKMYAEVWNGGFQALGLDPVATPDTFKFLVNIATDQPPTQDITLTIAVNDSARVKYNRINKKSYLLYPYITILNPSIVIKAGTRNAYCYVKIWNANLLSACDNFMAPISIVAATGGVIPADPVNNGSRLMALPISNPYAGGYQCHVELDHPTSGHIVYDIVKQLKTVSCNTVSTEIGGLGLPELDITINADNTVTLGGAYSSTQPIVQITTDPNVYNPLTKTFTISYEYTGSGGFRVYHDTYVKL